jgi:UDP-N-acetylmuramate-alanine ligase
VGDAQAAADYLLDHVAPDDVVITMSAGDGNLAGAMLLAGLRERDGAA